MVGGGLCRTLPPGGSQLRGTSQVERNAAGHDGENVVMSFAHSYIVVELTSKVYRARMRVCVRLVAAYV